MSPDASAPAETVDEFRARARAFLAETLPRLDGPDVGPADGQTALERARVLQRRVWDGGFAGICWPAEHAGLGLPVEYQRAFTEEAQPFERPVAFDVPTFGILAATLIDFGTDEQKARHLPAILRGDELWVQFLSEPTGGSDLAGCVTRADRDGDVFVLNGSKVWSTAADASDYAMVIARTNWDAPKHRGLTMFIIEIHQPGVEVEPIKQVDGSMEFCQEYFDDVAIPVGDVVGEIDDGWSVAQRLLLHERTAVAGGSPYTSWRGLGGGQGGPDLSLVRLADATGRSGDRATRQIVAEHHVEHVVNAQLAARVARGIEAELMAPASGSILKLFHAVLGVKKADAALELAGSDLVVWPADDSSGLRALGEEYLSRQAMCLGGGSNEIQRNIISERVLGMPREWAADRDVPFRDVRRNPMTGPPSAD